MTFQNKKVVITGASPDFGQSLAILFAKMGAELFLSARTLEKAEATAALVRSVAPAKVHTFQANVSKADEIARFAADVNAITSEVDILINNASLWLPGRFSEVSDVELMETISSTATGSILITKYFLPLIEKSSTPDIVFVNSAASLPGNSHPTVNEAFSAAKAAQSTFADRLRYRLKGRGIRVISIYPPNFDNPSPLDDQAWNEQRGQTELHYQTARNIFECIRFSLAQDRVCSIDKIILSNNNTSTAEVVEQ